MEDACKAQNVCVLMAGRAGGGKVGQSAKMIPRASTAIIRRAFMESRQNCESCTSIKARLGRSCSAVWLSHGFCAGSC